MGVYKVPKERLHRDFFYLDDEVVINSLSVLKSGKIDEIVSRVTTAREGGFSGELKIPAVDAGVGGNKKSSSEVEEEMVRTRTRFSVFDAWYRLMYEKKAMGTFAGWGPEALDGVSPGDTLEFRCELSLGPLQTVLRLYLWFAGRASQDGNMLSQRGEQRKVTKAAASNIRELLGVMSGGDDDVPLLATPLGGPGPAVLLSATRGWMIGRLGELGGEFGVVAQVVRIVHEGSEYPVMKLTKDVSPTPLEIATLKNAVSNFVEPARSVGVMVEESESVICGPAMIVKPIAIYR